MRVYELAWVLRVEVPVVIERLREDGEWVSSHLSSVPAPVAKRLLANPPEPTRTDIDPVLDIPRHLLPWRRPAQPQSPPPPEPIAAPVPRRPRRRGRPGPAPLSLKPPWKPEHEDYYDCGEPERQYGPTVTTRDVARMFGVSQATVRQWVRRGHISPIGKHGISNVFNTGDVVRAHHDIESRTRETRQFIRTGRGNFSPFDRPNIPAKYHDVVVDITQAAGLVNVTPATIRSWIHRGHLKPLQSSKPRATRLRIRDVITAARRGRRKTKR